MAACIFFMTVKITHELIYWIIIIVITCWFILFGRIDNLIASEVSEVVYQVCYKKPSGCVWRSALDNYNHSCCKCTCSFCTSRNSNPN